MAETNGTYHNVDQENSSSGRPIVEVQKKAEENIMLEEKNPDSIQDEGVLEERSTLSCSRFKTYQEGRKKGNM